MNDRERAVADELLAADSVKAAEMVLLKPDTRYDVDALLAELDLRRGRLTAQERHSEAELVDFLIALVQRRRGAVEKMAELRDHAKHSPKRTWPGGFPEEALSPRMVLERRVCDLVDAGNLDDALVAAHQADEVACVDPADQSVLCTSRLHLASALRKASRSREAYEILKDVRFVQAGGTQLGRAYTDLLAVRFHTLQGLLRDDMGYYRLGRSSFEAARDAATSAGHVKARIECWIHLAASYMKTGKNRHAVRELRRALQFAESLPDPRAVVAPLTNLGRALQDVGEYDAARSCYQRVLTTLDRLGVNSTSRSAAWFGLGDIAHHEGDGQGAVDAYLKGYLNSLGTDGARISLFDLVNRLDLDDLPEDNPLFGTVLAFLDMVPGAHEDWPLMMSLRIATARFNAQQYRFFVAVADLRELLEESARRGVDRQLRLKVINELAKILLRQGDHHRAMAELDDIVQFSERAGRGHLLQLSDKLADALAHWRKSGRPGRQTALQDAFDLLWRTHEDLVGRLSTAPDDTTAIANHRAVYQTLVGILVEHGDELPLPNAGRPVELAFDLHEEFKAHGFLAHLAHVGLRRGDPIRFSALRDHLRSLPEAEQCAYVSFFCGEASTTVFTYIPATDRLTAVESPIGAQQITKMVERLHRTFDGDPNDFPPKAPLHPRRPWRRSIGFLDELTPLLSTFLPQVDGRILLYVSCDGPLHGIPLSAIPTPEGPVLAARHPVVHVASASTLLYTAAQHTDSHAGETEVFCAGVAAHEDSAPDQLESDATLLSAAGWPVTALAGPGVTRQAVLDGMRNAHIAHITCHGYFDVHEPLDSGLLLAHAGKRPSKMPETQSVRSRLEHLLTVRDIARGALQPSLLTLRACATGLRDEYAAEDLDGLVQALLCAGVHAVVASLWNVNEHSSRQLLTDFYRNLRTRPGEPVWRAFWNAQRRMLENPDHPWQSHPYHWAALALFGDWRRQ